MMVDWLEAGKGPPILGRFFSVDKDGGNPGRPQTLKRNTYLWRSTPEL